MSFLPDISLHTRKQKALLGHTDLFHRLCNSFDTSSLRPVWMICGDRGIGKATFAYALARHIFKGFVPEKILESQFDEGFYPNLLVLERREDEDGKKARDIPVEESRKVISFLKQTPSLPGPRVVIIDAIDEMNRNGANALLKIIEEPPQNTYIFMICHSLGNVLPTIKSRAARLDLKPLSKEILAPLVLENFKDSIPFLSQGSIGRAVALMQIDPPKLLTNLARSIQQAAAGKIAALESFISTLTKNETAYALSLDLIPYWLHRLILFSTTQNLIQPLFPDENKLMQNLIEDKPLSHWIKVWQATHSFLQQATTSYLDKSHVLWALYCIIEQPKLGDPFVQASQSDG